MSDLEISTTLPEDSWRFLAFVKFYFYRRVLIFSGRVTTLAGSAQGYKDGIGENAKFRHVSGNVDKAARWGS